jgi:YaiO family outer membrane protein
MTRCIVAVLTAGWLAAAGVHAQTWRAAAWGSYEGVTNSPNWSTTGGQLTFATARGDAVWAAAELVGRFGATDATERIGGVFPATQRWVIAVEVGTARRPEFMPKNTWEASLTARVSPQASLGLGYRRWNYVVGPVDIVIPQLTIQARGVSWDLRAYVSRNPSQRTDAAFTLRATRSLTPRVTAWVLGAAGRESYLVGTPPASQVRSLDIVTGAAGLRYDAGSGFALRIEASVIRSRPVLSRRGVGVGIERQL